MSPTSQALPGPLPGVLNDSGSVDIRQDIRERQGNLGARELENGRH